MAQELTVAPSVAAPVAPDRLRPVELVDITEYYYRRMFKHGLGLMLAGALVSIAMIVYGGIGSDDALPLMILSGIAVAELLIVSRADRAYGLLRRNPERILSASLVAALLLAGLGSASQAFFFATATVLGIVRVACSTRVILAGSMIVALGLLWPVIEGSAGRDAQTIAASAGGLILIPVGAGLLFDYLARFTFNLQLTVDRAAQDLGREPSRTARFEMPVDAPNRERGRTVVGQLPATTKSHREVTHLGRRSQAGRLTVRQLEALALASEGLRLGEIAACLDISVRQVRRLLEGARSRTGTGSTAELVAWAARNRIFGDPPDRGRELFPPPLTTC